MLVALPAGVAIGLVMGLVGAGGSILAVPVLVYLLGEDAHTATAGALVIVLATSTVGALARARGGERPRLGLALAFAAAAWPGAIAGAVANRALPDRALLGGFALVLLAAAAATSRLRVAPPASPRPLARDAVARLVLAGLGVGVLTGVFGVGGGFLIVPALVVVLGLPTAQAMTTSLVVIALTSTVALGAHTGGGGPDWLAVAPLAALAAAGAAAGARVAGRLSPGVLRAAFSVLVVVVATGLGAAAVAPSL